MTEIPLVYPSLDVAPRRYLLSEQHRLVIPSDPNNNKHNFNDESSIPIEDALYGAASASSIVKQDGTEATITTSVLIDAPSVISVAMSSSCVGGSTNDFFDGPSMIQIDLRDLSTYYDPVKIQAFNDIGNMIRLTLVDSAGSIISLRLSDKLIPMDEPFLYLTAADYVEKREVLDEIVGSEVHASMVIFLSPHLVCLGLSPFIMTVDLSTKSSVLWSETQCLEDMKTRTSSLGSMLHQASGLLLGKFDAKVMDMPPVAAMCVAATSNLRNELLFVFTLHSDSSIRKWLYNPGFSLSPFEVHNVKLNNLPSPATWSDQNNAVSLCARLYQQVYVLAIHIKTTTNDRDYDDDPMPDCHIWAVHANLHSEYAPSCLELSVPTNASSLVGMCFNPTKRCTLSAVFQSSNVEDGIIPVSYQPSVVSILSTKPELIATNSTLDGIAKVERARIAALCCSSGILDTFDTTIKQDLHKLDTIYLKQLFRPIYPRGTGTVLPPSSSCIRQAVTKLVPGCRNSSGMSIELFTLRSMYDWRNRENRKTLSMTTPKAINGNYNRDNSTTQNDTTSRAITVYESYVQIEDDDDDDDDMVTTDMDDDMIKDLESDRIAQVEAHENRWRRLCLQVWEEELTLRHPLHVGWVGTGGVQLLVRAGVITTMTHIPKHPLQHGPWQVIDDAAMNLLESIETNTEKSKHLYEIEHELGKSISEASLALSPRQPEIIDSLQHLASWAWPEGDETAGAISDLLYKTLGEAVAKIPFPQFIAWLQQPPTATKYGIDGLVHFEGQDSKRGNYNNNNINKQVASHQVRLASAGICARSVDATRRIHLGRCLLLLDLVEANHAFDAAFRSYLHSLAVLWAGAQKVTMPTIAFQNKNSHNVKFYTDDEDIISPPKKRPSLGDHAAGFYNSQKPSMTTATDVMILKISQKSSTVSGNKIPLAGPTLLLCSKYYNASFTSGPSREQLQSGSAQLPELGCLPPPSPNTEYPSLALRLIAPMVAYKIPEESNLIVSARNECLAECLLMAAADGSSAEASIKLKKHACDLLVPKDSQHGMSFDNELVQAAFDCLDSLKVVASPRQNTPSFRKDLVHTMQRIIYGTQTDEIPIEIIRLSEMESVKSTFAPLVASVAADLTGVSKASILMLANIMLHISRLLRRLDILNQRLGSSVAVSADNALQSAELHLDFIVSAIKEMETLLPKKFCQSMPEYVNLWARLFSQSVVSGSWDLAYTACLSNPVVQHRESNLHHLVKTMVERGALQKLIEMCKGYSIHEVSGIGSPTNIDLYEVASIVLADAITDDIYTTRAAASDPSFLTDYQGALYSLHVSQSQWRRAAQTMELRYFNARKALQMKLEESQLTLGAAVLRDGLIAEDLSLAAVSVVNSLELVEDPSHRFLVSGELGSYHALLSSHKSSTHDEPRVKRSFVNSVREGAVTPTASNLSTEDDDYDDNNDDQDRLSKFVSDSDVESRAIRTIALRALFFDGSSEPSTVKLAFLRETDQAHLDIDMLWKFGYYRYGLLLAKTFGKTYESISGGAHPGGRDLFADSLSYLLTNFLAPLAMNVQPTSVVDGTTPVPQRPSLHQVHSALDDAASSEGDASYIVACRSGKLSSLKSSAIRSGVMELVRKLTLTNTTIENPVALDVAQFLLNVGKSADIPPWLHGLLIGSNTPVRGLFAQRSTIEENQPDYQGDPSALLSLYMTRGRLTEACNVAITILSKDPDKRASQAPSRVPEKGNIDFVPYNKLDTLVNLIDLIAKKQSTSNVYKQKIQKSRNELVTALEKHFSLLQISEAGLKSARSRRF